MPILPTLDDLGNRPVPQDTNPIVSYQAGQVGAALAGVGQDITKTAEQYQVYQSQKDQLAVSYGKAALMQKHLDIMQQLQDNPNPETYTQTYSEGMDDTTKQITANMSPRAQALFGADAALLKARGGLSVVNLAKAQYKTNGQESFFNAFNANKDAYASAPDAASREFILNSQAQLADATEHAGYLTPIEKFEYNQRFVKQSVSAYYQNMPPAQRIQELSKGAVQPNETSAALANPDNAINYMIDHVEGSQLIPNDNGKGPTKFGINQTANPEVDVPNLTREQAAGIYKKKYWDGIGADSIPENMRYAAFDTAVNMGPDTAKAMVDQSGNDPQKLLDSRSARYSDLGAKQPDNAPGWSARDANVQSITSGNGSHSSVFTQTGTPADHLDPGERRNLLDAAYADQDRALRLQREQDTAAAKQTQNDFLGKLYSNKLTSDDVLNSNLPAFGEGSKQEFLGLIRKGPNTGNPMLHQQLYMDALNNKITDPSQLVPYIQQPNGLSTEEAQNLSGVLEKKRDQVVKTFDIGAKTQITGRGEFMPDPEGDAQFSKFLFAQDNLLAEGAKKGLTPSDLLDPTSKNYVGDRLVSTYRRSMDERIGAQVNSARDMNASSNENARKADETPEDWFNRMRAQK